MARPGRPRNHDPLADEISRAIRQGDLPTLQSLVTTATVNISGGETRTPLFDAISENNAGIIKRRPTISTAGRFSESARAGFTHAKISRTTFPWTSVSRKSRPA
jgi:hypothetical protein